MRTNCWLYFVAGATFAIALLALVDRLGWTQLAFEARLQHQISNGWHDEAVEARVLPMVQGRREHVNSWCGVGLVQFPEDLVVYQDIIYRVEPDVIVETGTFQGGLTLYMASLLDLIQPEGEVVTVDYNPEYWLENGAQVDIPARARLLEHITFVEGSSTAEETLSAVQEHIDADDTVMVILDSLHGEEHVLREIELYSELVSKGSYLIVNDTHLDGTRTPWDEECGVRAAIDEWLPEHPEFVYDAEVSPFIISCSHGGFLKRVR